MAACKYLVKNGMKVQIDLVNEAMALKAKGYTLAQIAEKLGLSEAEVINITTRE